jgi:uncharacterized protein
VPDYALALGFLLVAVLYASVGHGGASGYLALMALAGFAPEALRPLALFLNVAVSLIATVLFLRAGHFRGRLFWPFAAASIPLAYLGGSLHLPPAYFKLLLAITLGFAAVRLLLPPAKTAEPLKPPPYWLAVVAGAAVGLLSGLVGVGGGIFLAPLLLFCRWADSKQAAAACAPFILVNSLAGLAGLGPSLENLPAAWPLFVAATVIGGVLGARWGSNSARPLQLRPALGAVLVIASVKLLLP